MREYEMCISYIRCNICFIICKMYGSNNRYENEIKRCGFFGVNIFLV